MLKIVIFDDHRERREAIRLLVNLQDGMECVGDFEDCSDLVNNLSAILPDVVLMDVNMPGVTGLEGVRLSKQHFPRTYIIMQTVFEDDENLFNCLLAGADDYLLKKAPNEKLIFAILNVTQGIANMTPVIAKRALTYFGKSQQGNFEESLALSKNECDILTQLVNGFSRNQIGLNLSVNKIEIEIAVKNIYHKLHNFNSIINKYPQK